MQWLDYRILLYYQDNTGIFKLLATGDNVVNNELSFIPHFDNIHQIQDERFAFGIGGFLDLTGPDLC